METIGQSVGGQKGNKIQNVSKHVEDKLLEVVDIYSISYEVINEKFDSGESFSMREIAEEIRSKGGIQRVSAGVTINMYIEKLELAGLIFFDPKIEKYRVIKDANVLKGLNF